MRTLIGMLAAFALLSLTGSPAAAATLTTFPLSAGTDGIVQCEILNLGDNPINVTLLPVRVTPPDGPVFDPVACPSVATNSRCVVQINVGEPIDLYCKFMFNGSKATVRALIETLTTSGTATAALPAN